jgi:hypothetical protein
MGPKSFEWKDLSIVVASPQVVAVTALFDLGDTLGIRTFSYTALLVKRLERWRIRIEDESVSPLNYTTQAISGNRESGTYKYRLTARPGASIAAHRHSADMQITVRSGRKFTLSAIWISLTYSVSIQELLSLFPPAHGIWNGGKKKQLKKPKLWLPGNQSQLPPSRQGSLISIKIKLILLSTIRFCRNLVSTFGAMKYL